MKQRADILKQLNGYKLNVFSSPILSSLGETTSKNEASFNNQEICKAGISQVMGRNPAIMNIDHIAGTTTYLSYTRGSDGTKWKFKCKVEGNQLMWGNHDGRWRTHITDSRLYFTINSGLLTIKETYSDGSVATKSFRKNQLDD